MPLYNETWISNEGDSQPECRCISSIDLPDIGSDWHVSLRTLRGGLSDGVELIEVDNGRMKLSILPTRGMGVWRAELSNGETFGWRSPIRGPVHPKFVPIVEPSGMGWLEGFDELVVRCGLESNGAPAFDSEGKLLYPLHGRIANRPAYHVEVIIDESTRTLTVRGWVEEARFHFQKLRLVTSITTSIDSTSFTLHDEVMNIGGTPAEMQLLYHINIGEPLLGPGSQFIAPVTEVAPYDGGDAAENIGNWDTFSPGVAGAPERCYGLKLLADEEGQTKVILKSADSTSAAVVRFNIRELPYFTIWKNMVASADGYVTGLEPATNLPNPKSFEAEQGRVIQLAPEETWTATVSVDWLTTTENVAENEADIERLKGDLSPILHRKPLPGWTPTA